MLNMRFVNFIALAFASVIMLSCTQPEEKKITPDPEPIVVPDKLELSAGTDVKPTFTSDGGDVQISFTASTPWTASVINTRADNWISVSPSSGNAGSASVTVTVDASTSYDERGATVRISCGTVNEDIVVTQKQLDALILSPSRQEMTVKGGTITIKAMSNVSYTYEIGEDCAAWVTEEKTKGLVSTDYMFRVAPNEQVEPREGTIVFNGAGKSETVHIYQHGITPTMVISKNRFVVDEFENEIKVEVSSNVDVAANVVSGSEWISEVQSESKSTNTFVFSIGANNSENEREGEIEVVSKAGNLRETVMVHQMGAEAQVIKVKEFDPSRIVSSFGVISDVHIDTGNGQDCHNKFTNALKQLGALSSEQDPNGLDGVLVAGDFTQTGYNNRSYYDSEISRYKSLYESVFDPVRVPMIYALGNHDPYGWWGQTAGTNVYSEAATIRNKFGGNYELTDIEINMRDSYECRHCVVGRYHILCVTPNTVNPVSYDSAIVNWLDATLEDITTKYPERYVILLTHPMIYNTVYGSLLGPEWMSGTCSDYWYTKALTSVLEKYPQVMTFSGHLHFPINDPRSIWQGDFTSFGCGSVRYMAIEDGKYEEMSSATVMKDASDISSGLLLQFDASGNARITRMFFSQNTTFGEPWTISYPQADKSHLSAYNHENLRAQNTPPTLSDLEIQQIDKNTTSKTVFAKFSAAEDDLFAHHYVLELKKNGSAYSTKRVLADFYRNAQPSQMKKTWTQSLGDLQDGEYELAVTAYDSWDSSSNTLKTSFTVNASEVTPSEDASIYADLSFANGKVADVKGKVVCTNVGASFAKTDVLHKGKSYNVDALNITGASQYVLCRFDEMSDSGSMVAFAAKSFCVETFFVDKAPGGKVHGIVCGTQTGGWGLALRANGKPYFIVGDATQNTYRNVDATSAASTTELTHLIAVYDYPNKQIRLYVNGVSAGFATFNGPFYPGTGDTFNKFCLGDDIKPGSVAGDFPAENMTIVSAKIYSGVMDDARAAEVYNEAVSNLQ